MGKSKTKSEAPEEIELRPDAQERFERAVDAALHHKPIHKPKASASRASAKTSRPDN